MFGYYYAALMTVFLLFYASGAVWVKTTKSLRQLAECGRMEQLQIVDAVYGQQKNTLPTSDLIAIYNAADKAAGRDKGDQDAIHSAREKLGEIEDRLGENFTVRFFCVSGEKDDAVNPCRFRNMTRTSKRSVLLTNEAYLTCSQHCILKPSESTGAHYIAWNVLVNQTQSSSFRVVYSTDGENDWQCLDTGFKNLSTSETPLHLQFSWKSKLNVTRLWFSVGGVPFDIECYYVEDPTVPTCSRKSTTSVATTTTSKSVAAASVSSNTDRTPETAQSDNLTERIITVVVPVAGVVIIAIIVAVVVYQVKKQSQDPVRQTNPGTNQSAAVTNAQFEPSPPTAGGAFMFHNYSVLQVPPPPETGTADPKEDAEKDNRKRKAYCHYADDYEEWDFQKIARERAAIQNNM